VNSDITSLSGLSTPLSIGQGGTAAGTASDALVNLGAASLSASNTFSGANVLSNPANTFAGTFSGNGADLSSLDADNISAGVAEAAFDLWTNVEIASADSRAGRIPPGTCRFFKKHTSHPCTPNQ
jgi:hypothetical protein